MWPENCVESSRDTDVVGVVTHSVGESFGDAATIHSIILLQVTHLAHKAGLRWDLLFGLSMHYFG